MKFIFASHNANKVEEVKKMTDGLNIEISSLTEIGFHDEIEETGTTLEANARIKSLCIFNQKAVNVFSEDTGLEIQALNNAPGVHTARYAGPTKDPDANMDLVLKNLKTESNRKAQFRTVISLILEGKEHQFEGICKGSIGMSKTGSTGFGYDPIFIPEGHLISFAEMGQTMKNSMSHRKKAFDKMLIFLEDLTRKHHK